MSRRVVVTGIGAVCPIGTTAAEAWKAAVAGRSGVVPLTLYDASPLKTQIAGLVPDFDLATLVTPKFVVPPLNRRLKFALAATEMAIRDSGLELDRLDTSRVGLAVGSNELHSRVKHTGDALATVYDGERFEESGWVLELLRKEELTMEQFFQESHEIVGLLALQYEIRGPVASFLTACAAGSQSLGEGYRSIKRGTVDVSLSGGTDSMLHPLDVVGFNNLGALSRRNDEPQKASRPFDVYRDGFVLGEGAGIFVLEELEHARARGAEVYAEVVGFGVGMENYHLTAMSPDAIGPVTAIRRALADARLAPEAIGYINAHGTSTVENDIAETLAIKTVFGDHARGLPISSTKSMTGHLVAAAGAVEAVFTVLSLRDRVVHPTINYETPDPECDLDYVPNEAREFDAEFAASNSFGFGGQNVTLVFRRADSI
jgi:3-oxoacyl-[acyl-carrier-protein] synthase II